MDADCWHEDECRRPEAVTWRLQCWISRGEFRDVPSSAFPCTDTMHPGSKPGATGEKSCNRLREAVLKREIGENLHKSDGAVWAMHTADLGWHEARRFLQCEFRFCMRCLKQSLQYW